MILIRFLYLINFGNFSIQQKAQRYFSLVMVLVLVLTSEAGEPTNSQDGHLEWTPFLFVLIKMS